MRIKVSRTVKVIGIHFGTVIESHRVAVAHLEYETGRVTLIQAKDWREFIAILKVGPQYSADELANIFAEIKAAGASDDPVVYVHRPEPSLPPE